MARNQRYTLLLLFGMLAALAVGCASPVHVARYPLRISEPPASPPALSVSIGLVRLARPLSFDQPFDERFLALLADGLENGMLQACRLVDPGARLLSADQIGNTDLVLIPANPFLEVGRGTYGPEVTLSMEIRLIQKGQEGEKGILVEVDGHPGPARPHRQVELLKTRYGLIGERIVGSQVERAVNNALFDFSVTFAEKVARRADRFELLRLSP